MITVLFDIDGTLIQTGGAGGAALLQAFSEEFGVANPQPVPFSGRTDRGICWQLFRLHGLPATLENWQRLRHGYLTRLVHELQCRQGSTLPGVRELLDHLVGREGVAVGLLTGNLREGARLKLNHFGLFDYFPFGGFGDEHEDRDRVAGEAFEAAQTHVGPAFRADAVWVIGDTPLDVQCARAIQARVVAVATGMHPKQELASTAPDHLVEDLSDTHSLLRRMGLT